MCNRPDFEAEDQELDQRLLSLFHSWKKCQEFWLEPEEIQQTDFIELFCCEIRNWLPKLLCKDEDKKSSERTPGTRH